LIAKVRTVELDGGVETIGVGAFHVGQILLYGFLGGSVIQLFQASL